MKATPGPWRVLNPDQLGREIYAGNGLIASTSHLGLTWDEEGANARLIASAPDLLGTLAWTLEQLNTLTTDAFSKGGDRAIRNRLQDAIIKARP